MNMEELKPLWIKEISPHEPRLFQKRIEISGQCEEKFLSDLRKSNGFQSPTNQLEALYLKQACQFLRGQWDLPLLDLENNHNNVFADLWLPIRDWSLDHLRQKCTEKIRNLSVADEAWQDLADGLLKRLCFIGKNALWETFNQSRSPGVFLLAHVQLSVSSSSPASGRDYYKDFIQINRKDGLQKLFCDYPVLSHFVGVAIRQWIQSNFEMLARIAIDRSALEQQLELPCDCVLSHVVQNLGDPHRDGRSVAELHFGQPDGAQYQKLIYKPKDLSLDAIYSDLVTQLNRDSQLDPLKALRVVSKDGYGYTEYVRHEFCSGTDELEVFYFNAGRLLAILYLLGSTDCHHENLIASGKQLLLIDTETLFDGTIAEAGQRKENHDNCQRHLSLSQRTNNSVLKTSFLPTWTLVGKEKEAVDVSALGVDPPSSNTFKTDGWKCVNTDAMFPAIQSVEQKIPTSLPVGIGLDNPLTEYLDELCQGFQSQGEELIRLKQQLLAPDSSLYKANGLPQRVVLRNTDVYAGIQKQQLEANALKSFLNQSIKLEKLSKTYLVHPSMENMWPIFSNEIQQLWNLDIPLFSHSLGSSSFSFDDSGEMVRNFFELDGLEAALMRIRSFNQADIDFQLQLIKGSIQARKLKADRVHDRKPNEIQSTSILSLNNIISESRSASRVIDKSIQDLAITDHNGASLGWLAMELIPYKNLFSFQPIGSGLYSGTLGIAVLNHCLHQRGTRSADQTLYVQNLIQPLYKLAQADNPEQSIRWWRDQSLGLSGCGGVLLGLLELGEHQTALNLIQACVPRMINEDTSLDIISGVAGLIGPLLALNTQLTTDYAIQAGERLLTAQTEEGGWFIAGLNSQLLGFSHGTSGMMAALMALYRHTKDQRFLSAARKALTYERKMFNHALGAWPDLRYKPDSFMTSWCHGAPGIAISRVCLWGTAVWDDDCAKDIETAIEIICADTVHADNICCGNAGLLSVLDLLLSGSWPLAHTTRVLAETHAQKLLSNLIGGCKSESGQIELLSPHRGYITEPGFFTGLSGVGMSILRDSQSKSITWRLISAGLYTDE